MNEDQMRVFLDRYALKDKNGAAIESRPNQMWQRVADGIADNVLESEEFYGILEDFRFVPGGRILASAGSGHEVTAYNCFVIPLESDNGSGADSREAIFDTVKKMVGIMSRGGGVGINWSTLRPSGSHLARVNGTSSGPIGWMDVASRAVGEVIQGGSRRGAAMFMLNDWHPDIEAFIDAKRKLDKITNANVSVAISDDFMRAVKEDEEWDLMFPDTNHPAYNSEWDGDIQEWNRRERPIRVYRSVKARDLWYKIAESAWDNGEPGVVFLGRCQTASTANKIEKIISVNPCGEQPLGAYSVCNLGSMNLKAYTKDGRFDLATFYQDVQTAAKFLDKVIDKTYYLDELPQTKEMQEKIRRIGLGVMGLADSLILQGIRYGSPEAVEFTKRVFYTMKVAALKASTELAAEKGAAPGWDHSMLIESPYLQDLPTDLDEHIHHHGLRNLLVLTQAPTGTTAMLAGVNSGIEPYFAFTYTREDRLGKRSVLAPILKEVESEIVKGDLPYLVTSEEVTVEEHIAMQAAAQQFIDSSVSKTINAPNGHRVEDVEKAFMLAWDSNLKGVAYFRDGCGRDQVLTREGKEESETGRNYSSEAAHNGSHETYRKDGCTYCRQCSWSACDL